MNLAVMNAIYALGANVSGFIAQLVRASHRYRKVTGLNPVEVLIWSAFLLYRKTGKNFRVKGTGQFSPVKMERDEGVPFTPRYVKKNVKPARF